MAAHRRPRILHRSRRNRHLRSLKNIIIVAGRNIFPADIEKLGESVHGVRAGGVIAFGITNHNGPEQIRIVAEVADLDSLHNKDIRRNIAKKVFSSIGISPSVILQAQGIHTKNPLRQTQSHSSQTNLQRGSSMNQHHDAIISLVASLAPDRVERSSTGLL